MFNARKAFGDVVRGYSKNYWNNKEIFFKHFNNLDLADLESENERFTQIAKDAGLLTEKEKIDYLIANDLWDQQKFSDIKVFEDLIKNFQITKKSLLLESQIQEVNAGIKENQKKLNKLLNERAGLIGSTVEDYVRQKVNEFYIFYSSFMNRECTERLFNKDAFDGLEDVDLGQLISIYNDSIDKISGQNIKRLAVSPDFQSSFHLAKDDAFHFYGIAVSRLTIYQSQLFIYGSYYKPMLSNDLKEELLDDPDKLVEYFHTKTNLEAQGKESGDEVSGMSIVGATKEDYAKMGNVKMVDLKSKMAEKGGALSAAEIMAAFRG